MIAEPCKVRTVYDSGCWVINRFMLITSVTVGWFCIPLAHRKRTVKTVT